MVIKFLLLVLLVLMFSCKVGHKKFINKREGYTGNSISTNGYFYCIDTVYTKPLGQPRTEIFARIYFFYRNGVMIYMNVLFFDFIKLEEYFKDGNMVNTLKENPPGWGIYSVRQDNLQIETWVSSTGGKHPNLIYDLTILNDSTIFDDYGKNIFHFKQFKFKPDSTNRFIE